MPEIQNPNLQSQGPGGGGGGGNMRSTMIFWLFLLLAFMGWQFFFSKPTPAPPQQTQTQQQNVQPPASQAAPSQAVSAAAQTQARPAMPQIVAAAESTTTVENELYRIVLTNRGGLVQHWILKKYFDTAGKPLDLVQPQAAERFGLPLAFYTYEPDLAQQLNNALYQATVQSTQTSPGPVLAPATLVFHYAANGLDVVKSIHFDSSYLLTIDAEVKRNGAPVRALIEWPAGLGDMEEFLPASSTRASVPTSANSQLAWSIDGNHTTASPNPGGFLFWTHPGISNGNTMNGAYQYAALMDLYFAAAFLPDSPSSSTMVTLHNTLEIPTDLSRPDSDKRPAHLLGLAVGDLSGHTRVRLFAGPKATDVLGSIHAASGESLQPLIQFGMWGFIAKPLYYALRFLKNMMGSGVNNWGWAIVIITVLFTFAMLPTRFMMMKSSLKMMRLQPKVDAIKKRYAHLKMNDPKRAEMNQEMMALYKAENVNMYGSCLPMLVQMPLFLAFYRLFSNAIDLRQAHWFWLHDLSMPDPLYILPILVILTMFVTQYITPSPGMDPAQRRMMAFMMPIIFGFSMRYFASGLALYWGTQNIINLALQIGINQSHWGKEMHAIAARRAPKKPGPSPKNGPGKR